MDKKLQESLHQLLSCLTDTRDHVRSWSDGSVTDHAAQTSRLINMMKEVSRALAAVESRANDRKSVQIPLDLLDLLDYCNLNPDMYSRGLLKEARSQLAGLHRRKMALSMLGQAVGTGLENANKRVLEGNDSADGPPTKKRLVGTK